MLFFPTTITFSHHYSCFLPGFMAVPGAAGGQFFGGFLCKRFKLKVKGCLRVPIICSSLAVLLSAVVWTRCDNAFFAGVTAPYPLDNR